MRIPYRNPSNSLQMGKNGNYPICLIHRNIKRERRLNSPFVIAKERRWHNWHANTVGVILATIIYYDFLHKTAYLFKLFHRNL